MSDIFGCINGRLIALECKRSLSESLHNTGRIVLQRKVIKDIQRVGGYSAFVYPENMEEILEDLHRL